jgi:glycolate oxidase iron-sulfur subunit
LEARNPDVIAAGNIGCMMQIGSATEVPIVHTVELLDWANGGPKPPALCDGAEKRHTGVPILK